MGKKEEEGNGKIMTWIENYLVDDVEINLDLGDITKELVYPQMKVEFSDAETVIVFYATVYQAILAVIQERRAEDSSFSINFCGRFEIGYTDSSDTENEKLGSLAPYLIQLESPQEDLSAEEVPGTNSKELAVEWNARNVKDNPAAVNRIMTVANEMLAKYNIELQSKEIIIPMFCIIHTGAIEALKTKFDEQYKADDIDTYEMRVNLFTVYDVFLRRREDGSVSVDFKPSVSDKQSTKNDEIATSKNE